LPDFGDEGYKNSYTYDMTMTDLYYAVVSSFLYTREIFGGGITPSFALPLHNLAHSKRPWGKIGASFQQLFATAI
jgi:hypothetical protein